MYRSFLTQLDITFTESSQHHRTDNFVVPNTLHTMKYEHLEVTFYFLERQTSGLDENYHNKLGKLCRFFSVSIFKETSLSLHERRMKNTCKLLQQESKLLHRPFFFLNHAEVNVGHLDQQFFAWCQNICFLNCPLTFGVSP